MVQNQKNGRGSFASVTVLGDSKSRDCVIIPEGRDTWGWRGFSHEMDHSGSRPYQIPPAFL